MTYKALFSHFDPTGSGSAVTPDQFVVALSRVGVKVPPKFKANLLRRIGKNLDGQTGFSGTLVSGHCVRCCTCWNVLVKDSWYISRPVHQCTCVVPATGLVSHREFKKFCITNAERVRIATALAQETKQEEERKRQREKKSDTSFTIDTKMGGNLYLSSTSIREMARQESAGSGLDNTLETSMSSTLPVSTYSGLTLGITSGADMPVTEALGDWARDSNKVTYQELQKGPRARKKKKTLVCTSATFLRVL